MVALQYLDRVLMYEQGERRVGAVGGSEQQETTEARCSIHLIFLTARCQNLLFKLGKSRRRLNTLLKVIGSVIIIIKTRMSILKTRGKVYSLSTNCKERKAKLYSKRQKKIEASNI